MEQTTNIKPGQKFTWISKAPIRHDLWGEQGIILSPSDRYPSGRYTAQVLTGSLTSSVFNDVDFSHCIIAMNRNGANT